MTLILLTLAALLSTLLAMSLLDNEPTPGSTT